MKHLVTLFTIIILVLIVLVINPVYQTSIEQRLSSCSSDPILYEGKDYCLGIILNHRPINSYYRIVIFLKGKDIDNLPLNEGMILDMTGKVNSENIGNYAITWRKDGAEFTTDEGRYGIVVLRKYFLE
jgi:hypothetical protein